MPRKLRFAPPGHNLHITQRGNYGQQTFFTDADHFIFLELLSQSTSLHSTEVLAYCLMPNHFHLILRGHEPASISRFMQSVSGQYAQYIHDRLGRLGRFWQNRFYSCLLDNAHLVAALRYVELNPVRAHMVAAAEEYLWSSARIHQGGAAAPPWLSTSTFHELFTPEEWQARLADGQSIAEQMALRSATNSQEPAGSLEFIHEMESTFGRRLRSATAGRRSKASV